ncbi:unnamed protein product [Thelazia callipaeda]|uniref:Phosphatidylinositol-4,5-bisphosphate 4-phosphatase n=1 Tax=Thelazia callipaeda TaxID=103827 RepID=A0A0N5CVI6_THECL|nr:unnamed protein product [Thelazia callipaeda]
MGDAIENEDCESAPLLKADQSSVIRNYEGLDDQNTINTPEEYVSRDEECHMVPQEQSISDTSGESSDTTRLLEPSVPCRVCSALITIDNKSRHHVVRCVHCNEATPIRPAPPGKKYVRCPCHCLLLCKASSNRIACPRLSCRRVITLGDSVPLGHAIRAPTGTCRIVCGHCHEVFMFNTLSITVAKCPHCKKISSVGRDYARNRAVIHIVCSVVSVVALIGLMIGTWNMAKSAPFIYLIWLFVVIIGVALFIRFIFFVTLKTSTVLGPLG